MNAAVAYAPPRDVVSKVRRRVTQWSAARPVNLAFERPLPSICFDDFPVSAAVNGARILEEHGVRGTFYAAVGLVGSIGPCGRNFAPTDARFLARRGHEIGNHTYAHADCARTATNDAVSDIDTNGQTLLGLGCHGPIETLAYPYGETTGALKRQLADRFACARGVLPGLNVGRTDLMQLRAYPLFGRGAIKRVHAALARAVEQKAWVIAFTHDVTESPSRWGTRASDLEALLQAAETLGVTVTPVREALAERIS